MDKAFDRKLSHLAATNVQTYIKDLADRIETWKDRSSTITDQDYFGYEKRYAKLGITARLNNRHAISLADGVYDMKLPASSPIERSGVSSRFEYMFADGTTSLRLGTDLDTDQNNNAAYHVNWERRIGKTPASI